MVCIKTPTVARELCRWVRSPMQSRWRAMMRMVRYLAGTVNRGIEFHDRVTYGNGVIDLNLYCNESFGDGEGYKL